MDQFNNIHNHFGPLVLFGSGETLPASGKAYELVANKVEKPLRISILETPAGFQPNSEIVAQKVGKFIAKRLQNYDPSINLIPARSIHSENSPNNPAIVDEILQSNWIFMGPGSPTYTINQLQDSLTLKYLYALHRMGAAITLSSAAVLAFSTQTLPVYEIYKVGEDLHWKKGLSFFSQFGCEMVLIPHWNNNDGGSELDTSRCFMGENRYQQLREMLPKNLPIIGIDEQTALIILFEETLKLIVSGKGTVISTIGNKETILRQGAYKPEDLGIQFYYPDQLNTSDPKIMEKISNYRNQITIRPDQTIIRLAKERLDARAKKDWKQADTLRRQIENHGWIIKDSVDGYTLEPKVNKN